MKPPADVSAVSPISRRTFVGTAVAALLAAPFVAQAQRAGKPYRIAVIANVYSKVQEALYQGLREHGYIEGQNLVVERRYSQGQPERFDDFAAEMVRLDVDAIVVFTTPAALAAKRATNTIPIVFATAIDPVGSGLVASLARPGGNVTGGAMPLPELSSKRLQLLKEVFPRLSRVAVLWNPSNPANAAVWRATERAADDLGITLRSYEVRTATDFDGALAKIARDRPEALHVFGDALMFQHRRQIGAFAREKRLPSVFDNREVVEAGGLMSYGSDLAAMIRRAADYVDKILKGAKPAELPMEQPTKFELLINMKAAKALGLTIPPSLLLRANEVIE